MQVPGAGVGEPALALMRSPAFANQLHSNTLVCLHAIETRPLLATLDKAGMLR